MTQNRINAYRNMWVLVFFDLPTETKKQRKSALVFRKILLKDGFTMFQFSIYLRFCSSSENAQVHRSRVHRNLPELGKVGVLTITDKQWSKMELYFKGTVAQKMATPQQLEMF